LRGTAVGDAFGQTFFGSIATVSGRIATRTLLRPPWAYTDDSVMALGVTRVLEGHGGIVPDVLARVFADAYLREPERGYGATARQILEEIGRGADWREVSGAAFGGTGSMGNGGAMRAAPIGAYFAGDPAAAVEHARLSAEVTHAHPEGQAGAIAVALAASWAWTERERRAGELGSSLLQFVLEHLPAGETSDGIARALEIGPQIDVRRAVATLGNG